ncbi:hypothetical protein N7478_010769 [Penicillium angulare]|uniref:uncharacterized protein n=1 Tax=Penicillium angulare TaxID=116970 RepID=UPI002542503B|nr:uncharacterized protein N7478_010769 [Penicillium angulare]KAJ5263164.1 hypothetical protein N7478_010769 [Penicillium angulare]
MPDGDILNCEKEHANISDANFQEPSEELDKKIKAGANGKRSNDDGVDADDEATPKKTKKTKTEKKVKISKETSYEGF